VAQQHIVVDGSNIATEGRSAPSLAQLEEAVAELRREHPDAEVTVIVDATFSHRIDKAELDRFERAVLAGEYVHPPAGAIGRGDAFLLRVAEKVDGTVLSNDSFQEFHGEHPWLFERGRLLGATPVPGIGWIFSPRTPVRGPTSRKAVRDTEKAKRQVTKAIKVATKEAVAPAAGGPRPSIGDRRVLRRASDAVPPKVDAPALATVNDPLTFVSFIAGNPLGAEVTGKVESYTSHGAVVMVGNTQCYVPLANLGDPPPRSAREVLKRGDEATFVVRALDPQRRGVELALPGVASVSGKPSAEMIKAEMQLARKRRPGARKAPAETATLGKAPAEAATLAKAATPAKSVKAPRKVATPPDAASAPHKAGTPAKASIAPRGGGGTPATASIAPQDGGTPARVAKAPRKAVTPAKAPTAPHVAGTPAEAATAPQEAGTPAREGRRANVSRKPAGARKAAAVPSEATAELRSPTQPSSDATPGPRRAPTKTPKPATSREPAVAAGPPAVQAASAEAPRPRKRPAANAARGASSVTGARELQAASPAPAARPRRPRKRVAAPAQPTPATKTPATKGPATKAPATRKSPAR
jgi:hypothetical protein